MTNKRQDILDAAEMLFATRGYGGTQISEITSVARTGISTFYRYFESKNELLGTLLDELYNPMIEQLRAYRAGMEHKTPIEQLMLIRGGYELVFDAMVARPNLIRVLYTSGFGASPEISERVDRAVDQIAADLVADLKRAEQTGLITVPDKSSLARGIISVLTHLPYEHIRRGEPSRDAAIDVCARMAIGAMGTYANPTVRPAFSAVLDSILNSKGDPS